MLKLVLAAVAVLALYAPSTAAAQATTAQLSANCDVSALNATAEDFNWCKGYVGGMHDVLRMLDPQSKTICTPASGVRVSELIVLLRAWVAVHFSPYIWTT